MIIPSNYAQVNYRFRGQAAPQGAEVTLGLNVDIYPGTPADAADDCYDAWNTTIRLVQANVIELNEVLVKFGPNNVGPSAARGSATAGAVSATSEVPNVAVLVQKTTGFGGRSGRGRFYWPGGRESLFDTSGTVDPTQYAAWQTQFNAFYNALVTAGLVPTLLHSAGAPISTPLPITSFLVSGTAATQRRRLRR
jgi:hypothetical protein